MLYVTWGGKISKKGKNWSKEFSPNNHLDNIKNVLKKKSILFKVQLKLKF